MQGSADEFVQKGRQGAIELDSDPEWYTEEDTMGSRKGSDRTAEEIGVLMGEAGEPTLGRRRRLAAMVVDNAKI